jgi:hypothetical protein
MSAMKMRWIISLTVLAAVSPLLAGPLAPVAPPPNVRAIGAPALEILPPEFRPATPQDGLIWSKATVATAELSPGRKVLIAIDASTPTAAGPDVIRFNFAGAGNFGKSVALPLKPKSADTWEFAQAVQVPLAGQEIPTQIFGAYSSRTGTQVNVQSARQGDCQFGEKTYRVLLIDGNRNFNFSDATKAELAGNLVTAVTFGDTLAVDTGDGSFKDATKVRLSFVGQPALVDGKWYSVTASPEQASVSAVAAAVQAGKVQVAHPQWSATLVGRKYAAVVKGAAEPVELPADDYALASYQETAGQDVFVYTDVFAKVPGPLSLKVAPGQMLDLKMGTPLTAKMDVQVSGKQVTVNFAMTDAGGHAMSDVAVNGDRPDAPQYEILSASGGRVHQATMHYG